MKKSGMFLIGALFLSMATGSFCNESPRAKLSILIREGKIIEAEAHYGSFSSRGKP